jgi:DNA-binding transcriptional regulator LsrR (DeoR family)
MARVPKTSRKEHETPTRTRYRLLIEQGESQQDVARRLGIPRGKVSKWIK